MCNYEHLFRLATVCSLFGVLTVFLCQAGVSARGHPANPVSALIVHPMEYQVCGRKCMIRDRHATFGNKELAEINYLMPIACACQLHVR